MLTAAGLLLVGVVTAVAAVAVHALWWGIPLVVAGLGTGLAAVGRGWLTRLPLALGFVLGVGMSLVPRAEGGYLVAGDTRGWLLLAAAVVAPFWAVATLPRPGRARESESVGPPT